MTGVWVRAPELLEEGSSPSSTFVNGSSLAGQGLAIRWAHMGVSKEGTWFGTGGGNSELQINKPDGRG